MLTIQKFHIDYHVVPRLAATHALRNRIDRIAQRRLPEQIQRWSQWALADNGAVYRIKQLNLAMWLNTADLDDGRAADQWARLLLTAVARELDLGPSGNVVRYESSAHYLAQFLSDLISGSAWSRWVYEEFFPLRDLPKGVVIAQLLAASPGLIVPVAELLDSRGRLDTVIAPLKEPDVRLIWTRGLGFANHADGPAVGAPAPSQWIESLRRTASAVPLTHGDAHAVARNALRLYLALTIRQEISTGTAGSDNPDLSRVGEATPATNRDPSHTPTTDDAALGQLCRQLAWMHGVWQSPGSSPIRTALVDPITLRDPAVIDAVSATTVSPTAKRWFTAAAATLPGRQLIAQLAQILDAVGVATTPATSATDVERYRDQRSGQALVHTGAGQWPQPPDPVSVSGSSQPTRVADLRPSPRIATHFAGLAFFLPIIRDATLHERMSVEGLCQLLTHLVGSRYAALSSNDPAPAWLTGLTADQAAAARIAVVDWPSPVVIEASQPWHVHVTGRHPTPTADTGVATFPDSENYFRPARSDDGQTDTRSGLAADWAAAVMTRFAASLRGFERTSASYLCRQFIALPGHLQRTDRQLSVHVGRAPLGIVLRMAGYDDDQGPVPWLDGRRLVIQFDHG